jgi:putative ABC transport system permease protein
VSRRSQELGIRLALGALPEVVLRLVVRQSLHLTTTGLVAGLAGAVLLGRLVRQQLYAVTPLDPLTLVLVAATLMVTAIVASVVPARRAARLDPARSMRGE